MPEESTSYANLMPFSVQNMEPLRWGEKGRRAERAQGRVCCVPHASSGTKQDGSRSKGLAMFRLSAYDPLGIAMMGFGVLVVAVLAFVY
jgi:hypothetical protein